MISILDLIAIIYIVVLSFIFCSGNDNIKNTKYSCLLSHIVIGLSVIVFYKLVRYFKLNDTFTKEKFDDSVTDSINNFIQNSGSQIITQEVASTMQPAQFKEYSDKLDTIINNLNALQQQQSNPDPLAGTNPANLNTLDLTSQQQYQMFQIDYLNKQIKNAQDIINEQSIVESTKNYKPIKIFSSCVVSNANGTTTLETPVDKNNTTGTPVNNMSPNVQQMFNTISQTETQPTIKPSTMQLSPNTGIFQSLLGNLSQINNASINN
jgi:hypothetical protein